MTVAHVEQTMSGADRNTEQARYERRLAAYVPQLQPLIQDVMSSSPALADLADSFPAMLHALATGYGTAAQRAETAEAIATGMPLRLAAEILGLPWWTRRLPPEAFTRPFGTLPDEPRFGECIASLIPQGPAAAPWLTSVLQAYRTCHSEFALWVAGWAGHRTAVAKRARSVECLTFLAAWAWHASAPETPGHALIGRPWTAQMGLRRAFDEVVLWRRRMALELWVETQPIPVWLGDGEARGYSFHGLRTAADFITEAAAMDNCLDQYSDQLARRHSHVFSIRKGNRRVADLEIGIADSETAIPAILQLRGLRNRRAAPEVWQAAYAWLGAQPLRSLPRAPSALARQNARRAAGRLWQGYLDAVGPQAGRDAIAIVIASEIGIEPAALARSARRKQPAPADGAPAPATTARRGGRPSRATHPTVAVSAANGTPAQVAMPSTTAGECKG